MIYSIDAAASDTQGVLVLTISETEGVPTAHDEAAFAFVRSVAEERKPHYHIPYSETLQTLKLIAATGQLYFKTKPIVIDLFTPVEFFFEVEKDTITGHLSWRGNHIPLADCDFICKGTSCWFINGISLKVIATDVKWRELQLLHQKGKLPMDPLWQRSLQQQNDEADEFSTPRTVFHSAAKHEPYPLLILTDRHGAFADLWMDYGNERQVPYHQTIPPTPWPRDLQAEQAWECDLLETDFIKKDVGTAHYYCPLDKVSKSLSFLLELGWVIQDSKGNKLLMHSDIVLDVQQQQDRIHIRGKVSYGDHQARVADVVGAFNRRERFVELTSGHIGLLPDTEQIAELSEGAELAGDALSLPRHQLASLAPLLNQATTHYEPTLQQLCRQLETLTEIPNTAPAPYFTGTLRPYQQAGVNWLSFLYNHGFHGILADDMGLGKTVQLLAFLSTLTTTDPILIVVPTSLLFNWQREIARFLPGTALTLHHGSERDDDLSGSTLILTSYAILRRDIALFSQQRYHCIVLDEAQAIKNASTQAAQAACALSAQFRLSITGTPIENHLGELWSQFRFLIPELLGDEQTFLADIQAAAADSRYLTRIRKKIQPFILRRNKEEVAPDLPEKIEQTVWLTMPPEQQQLYDSYLSGFRSNLLTKIENDGVGKHRMEVLEAILRLRQICCHPLLVTAQDEIPCTTSGKLDQLLSDIETIVEENKKVLIYSQFTSMLKLIANNLNQPYCYLDGTTKDRSTPVERFQSDPDISLFLISLKAGGVGLNLTAADYVILFDPWWNTAAENQAIDRAHRIGRHDTVIAKRYVIADSIEEKMMKLKEAKASLTDSILSVDSFSLDDFKFLLS
ncbi:MAG: DEAD/DEAH box helicase [Chlamydiales bacterium]|nr:DEAD/DEAH box helicase [Chlamydiia bacterium]MCP5506941.1 DEAD/DEAH box helicase [Chlamydiales bacterium]